MYSKSQRYSTHFVHPRTRKTLGMVEVWSLVVNMMIPLTLKQITTYSQFFSYWPDTSGPGVVDGTEPLVILL